MGIPMLAMESYHFERNITPPGIDAQATILTLSALYFRLFLASLRGSPTFRTENLRCFASAEIL